MPVIAVSLPKGGVGKTTTAAHLAAGLARLGHPTALIDLDPSGKAAILLGLSPGRQAYNWLAEDAPLADCLRHTARPDLFLVPASHRLARIAAISQAERWMHRRLADRLAEARGLVDYVVLDTPPTPSWLSEAALFAADIVISPVALDALVLYAVSEQQAILANLNRFGSNIHPVGWWLVPTFHDRQTVHTSQAYTQLKSHYPDRILCSISKRTALRETGSLIWEKYPDNPAAAEYVALVDAVRQLDSGDATAHNPERIEK